MISLGAFATKIFGSSNDRRLKTYNARVPAINTLEPRFAALSDDELRGKTVEFRQRLANGESLENLCRKRSLPSAKAQSARLANVTSTSSLSAAWCCTKARLPK